MPRPARGRAAARARLVAMHATTGQSWAPAPALPRGAAGAVHVWRADLRAVDDELGELLCEQELARAERLLSHSDRVRWTRCRGVLRALLARYLGLDPRALEFSLG